MLDDETSDPSILLADRLAKRPHLTNAKGDNFTDNVIVPLWDLAVRGFDRSPSRSTETSRQGETATSLKQECDG